MEYDTHAKFEQAIRDGIDFARETSNPVPATEKTIETALKGLEYEIGHLDDVLAHLVNRIQPVLAPMATEGRLELPSTPVDGSPLQCLILNQTEKLREMRTTIASVMERIDL